MSVSDIEVKCFSQCVANGIYDHVADAITSLGKDGLGEADFGIDWTTTVQDNYSGTNWSYVNTKDGRPFRTNIVGQIATSACGTKHSAKGTHFTKRVCLSLASVWTQFDSRNENVPLGDSDTVKWKWALSKPTLCSPNLADIWENQLTSIEDWVTEEKRRAATDSKINMCITKSSNELQYVDLIMLTSQRIYEKPEAHPRKVTPGALYDPRILYDYRGDYFQLRQNKLKQLNIYDTAENGLKLIPMHETYSKLRPGMLVLAVCDAHVYNMIQNSQPTSTRTIQYRSKPTLTNPQTFQLSVQAMKVLHPSDEPVEDRFIPILSTTSVDMSKDDSAIAGFSTFDLAISPTKKTKHANEQKHKGGKGKEKMD
ncbi:hypothetical protein EV702DRAFT_1044107 [Suillus placidus]|uniref:Uncharacterized protein n=1 Tax=Suillus placidus TaxID=48579 RepID=A0A9P6ZYL7_9AGAM|nr:hypothetical protein EV702DRAFT_1044107 [Suillus placidus]